MIFGSKSFLLCKRTGSFSCCQEVTIWPEFDLPMRNQTQMNMVMAADVYRIIKHSDVTWNIHLLTMKIAVHGSSVQILFSCLDVM
ncbi:uncharacterized [Tachysurus ichikawai]